MGQNRISSLLLVIAFAIIVVCAMNHDASAQSPSWRRVHIADSVSLSAICFADSLTGYAAGVRSVHPLDVVFYRTTDGGDE